MSQVWDKNGNRLPVTVVTFKPHTIAQVKNQETDGYQAIQVAFDTKKASRLSKPVRLHLKKHSLDLTPKHLKEIKVTDSSLFSSGDNIALSSVLSVGDKVNVTGVSKGHGFTGAMARWNFKGGPRTHGQSDRARAVGSIGQGTSPGRVWKGKRMPGRHGNMQFTIKNLLIVNINEQNGEVWIKGSIPGKPGSLISITKTGESKFPGLFDANPEAVSQEHTTTESQATSVTKE